VIRDAVALALIVSETISYCRKNEGNGAFLESGFTDR